MLCPIRSTPEPHLDQEWQSPDNGPRVPGGPRRFYLSGFYTIPHIRAKQELCCWTELCHFLSLPGRIGLRRSWQGLLRVPGGPKNRLLMSSDLGHPYVVFHPWQGISLPLPISGALMAHWVLEALWVLRDTQNRLQRQCHPWLSWPQLWTLRWYPALVYLVKKCPNPAKSG